MATLFGASIFSPSTTPAGYQQHGSRVSFHIHQRIPFFKLREAAPNSSWSLSLCVKAQVASVSESIEIPVTTESFGTAAGVPAHHSHLTPLISELTEGAHLPSAMEPWLDNLSIFDWDALLVDVGGKNLSVAWQLVSYFKEKAPELVESVLWPPQKKTEDDVTEGEVTEGEAASAVIPKKGSAILKLYTSLARVLAKNKRVDELEKLQQQMKEEGIEPVPSFYNVVLNFYIMEKLTEKTLSFVSEMEKAGYQPTTFTYEKMAFMFMKTEPLDLSVPTNIMKDLMKKGLPTNVSLFKNLLKAYWRNKDVGGVEEVFQAMQAAGHTPDQKDIFKVMYCQKQTGNYGRILDLMEMMTNMGITPNVNVYDQLIYAYYKAGLLDKAKESLSLYASKLGKKPTLVALNTLIHGYGKQGLHEEALQAFEDLRTHNYRPDAVSYSSIINALVNAEQLTKAGQIYRRMLRQEVQPKLHTYITLIRGYTKLDWTREGRKIAKAMQKSPHAMTPEAFGAIVVLFVEGHWYHLAAFLLTEMEMGNIVLDAGASATLIRSFCILGDKPTPLSKATESSNLEVCKLLTSLFRTVSDDANSLETAIEEEVLPFLEKWEKVEECRVLYNAFMECFWRRGAKTLARRLLSSAREVYAQSTIPRLAGSERVLDVRGLSVGGAKVALIEWLMSEGDGQEEIPSGDVKMVLITGDEFQLNVIQDNRVVKRALISMLGDLSSPFVESSEDPKKLEAVAGDFMKWVVTDKVKELMDFRNGSSL